MYILCIYYVYIYRGPSFPLNYAFSKRRENQAQKQRELCTMIAQIEEHAPQGTGVVVFFPSFAMLDEIAQVMERMPLWTPFIRRVGRLFKEPKQASELDPIMQEFTHQVR